jgi:hypothetical protein
LAAQSWHMASTCHPSSEASFSRHIYWERSKQSNGRRNWKGGCRSYMFDGEAPRLARPREAAPVDPVLQHNMPVAINLSGGLYLHLRTTGSIMAPILRYHCCKGWIQG